MLIGLRLASNVALIGPGRQPLFGRRLLGRGSFTGAAEIMSVTNLGASSNAQEGILYDEPGNRIGGAVRPNTNDVEPLVRFARKNPIMTTILALGVGYLIAKIF
jgi:hypothetical protein